VTTHAAEPVTSLRTSTVFGVPLHAITLAQTVDRIGELLRSGGRHQHVCLNAAKIVALRDDPTLAAIVRDCSLISADGQSIVWAARMLGVEVPERVTGIDLMDALLARAADQGWSVYFLGATDDVLEATLVSELERHPGLIIAGARNGYWGPDDEADVVAGVAASGADILLVAMPTPRKERFLAQHLDDLGVGFAMGVGGSFDVVAGVTKRAPLWMQKAGLEWAFRLLQEPRRMLRRYLVGNTRFIALTVKELLRRTTQGG
jgi:N-acetylglucosaminyldiphosphoundecaprenol N-acetyl-beta-D-mannosaminyltransferase